ncbi:AzlD domain-containing protein [Haloarcula onubensis]|uniref:AzlD domain-containing protein n=1 Tax=Haloarcula onubensis TaxID=2950539 RepID=A0ABU2FQ02_9EURY|nr:AzlD domain-containing protein [Halomicroarcula sp. S3CR25-11]MDS0282833.1 AzlD domain-containing protein [Halomicroarcula sp. S3CR25-11]
MATSYSGLVIWGLIAVIGVVTFLIRLSFIGLFGYLDEIPTRLERGLRFVPAAVLAALVLPSFLTLDSGAGGVALDRLAAGTVAGGVAWRTEDVFMTIGAGMATLWVVRFALLPAL